MVSVKIDPTVRVDVIHGNASAGFSGPGASFAGPIAALSTPIWKCGEIRKSLGLGTFALLLGGRFLVPGKPGC